MSEGKHTKGPWHFHPPYWGFSKITGPNGELIFGIAAGSPDEKRPDDVCEANARLIAAAPEMLEACKLAVAAMGDMNAAAIVRAAIALAEKGRQP